MHKPYITEGWKKFTFIAETFHEEISNTFNISVKVPEKARIIFYIAFVIYLFTLSANDNILIVMTLLYLKREKDVTQKKKETNQ